MVGQVAQTLLGMCSNPCNWISHEIQTNMDSKLMDHFWIKWISHGSGQVCYYHALVYVNQNGNCLCQGPRFMSYMYHTRDGPPPRCWRSVGGASKCRVRP